MNLLFLFWYNSFSKIDQSEICAVSGGSAAQPYAWYILLDGISITTNEKPKWDMDPKSKKKLENRRNN